LTQGGDRAALEQLVARHGPWIFNVAARMVWRRDDAADVTQEVLVKAITRLSSFRGESAFRTWLYRIVLDARSWETLKDTLDAKGAPSVRTSAPSARELA
jgi:RNA polymerase sigma factor (sigma-70 family)